MFQSLKYTSQSLVFPYQSLNEDLPQRWGLFLDVPIIIYLSKICGLFVRMIISFKNLDRIVVVELNL